MGTLVIALMNSPTQPTPPRSRYWPIGLTILAGALLAVGSCFGFIEGINSKPQLMAAAVTGIAAGVVLFLAGVILSIIWVVKRLIRGGRERP